jgi:hypothetical protein
VHSDYLQPHFQHGNAGHKCRLRERHLDWSMTGLGRAEPTAGATVVHWLIATDKRYPSKSATEPDIAGAHRVRARIPSA